MVVFKPIQSGIFGPSIDFAMDKVASIINHPEKCFSIFEKLTLTYDGLGNFGKEDVVATIQSTLCDIQVSLGASEGYYMETEFQSKHIKLNPTILLHNDDPEQKKRCQIMLIVKLLHECCHLLTTPFMRMGNPKLPADIFQNTPQKFGITREIRQEYSVFIRGDNGSHWEELLFGNYRLATTTLRGVAYEFPLVFVEYDPDTAMPLLFHYCSDVFAGSLLEYLTDMGKHEMTIQFDPVRHSVLTGRFNGSPPVAGANVSTKPGQHIFLARATYPIPQIIIPRARK